MYLYYITLWCRQHPQVIQYNHIFGLVFGPSVAIFSPLFQYAYVIMQLGCFIPHLHVNVLKEMLKYCSFLRCDFGWTASDVSENRSTPVVWSQAVKDYVRQECIRGVFEFWGWRHRFLSKRRETQRRISVDRNLRSIVVITSRLRFMTFKSGLISFRHSCFEKIYAFSLRCVSLNYTSLLIRCYLWLSTVGP